jgi:DNA-binding transcriptional ArsR family regulator
MFESRSRCYPLTPSPVGGERHHCESSPDFDTVNYMVQYSATALDASFAALSDATRRGVLEQLGRKEASITDLADRFRMTLTGMRKHVGVLEEAGLVVTEKVGRVRSCRIGERRLDEAAVWIERYQQLWDERFVGLDQIIEELQSKEQGHGRKAR